MPFKYFSPKDIYDIIKDGLQLSKRAKFKKFIEYLSYNNEHCFTLFPRICDTVFKEKSYNNLDISEMSIFHTYDMRKSNISAMTNPYIELFYTNEVKIKAITKSMKNKFTYYISNVYDAGTESFEESHGIQSYKEIPLTEKQKKREYYSDIRKVHWEFKKENITNDKYTPISFRTKSKSATDKQADTLLFYPSLYAKNIDTLNFYINFLGNNVQIKSAILKKVSKNLEIIPYSALNIINNTAHIELHIGKTDICEAYFIELKWEYI